MGRKKTTDVVSEPEAVVDAPPVVADADDPAADRIDTVEFDHRAEYAAEYTSANGQKVLPESEGTDEPRISDPEWTEFVLSRLTDDEKWKGNPTVAGLRRVAAELLGDIIENSAEAVQLPTLTNGMWSTVKATVGIAWTKDLADNQGIMIRTFTGLADTYNGNTEPDFARFSSAICETRAEGRAFRKALHLVRVVTSEELTSLPVEESGADGRIAAAQKNFIDLKCMQNDINVLAFIKACKGKYESIEDVPYDVASKMIGHLSEWQREKSRIPKDVKGYDANWNEKENA